MPLLRRRRAIYQRPRFPRGAEWIALVDPETGAEDGPFKVADFQERFEDGTWACATAGHPVWLRITEQKDGLITSLDGAGKAWRYLIVPLTDADLTGGDGRRNW